MRVALGDINLYFSPELCDGLCRVEHRDPAVFFCGISYVKILCPVKLVQNRNVR